MHENVLVDAQAAGIFQLDRLHGKQTQLNDHSQTDAGVKDQRKSSGEDDSRQCQPDGLKAAVALSAVPGC